MELKLKASGGGIVVGALLTAILILLKMAGAITWSWLWILSPLWISIIFTIVIAILLWFIIIIVNRNRW